MRVSLVVEKLAIQGLREFALTGSVAMEIHMAATGQTPRLRRLNDLDIVVESLASIPQSVADGFLFRHVHPKAIAGKTLMQLVDPDQALRIDAFRECGSTLERSRLVRFGTRVLKLVSLEDLAARAARVVMDLEAGFAVSRKHAEDFLRLACATNPDLAEIACTTTAEKAALGRSRRLLPAFGNWSDRANTCL
jgi:hypothetical protein